MTRRGILTFTKAMVSSQMASLVDIAMTFVLANVCGIYYLYSTLIGSVCGALSNCYVNYSWTFCAKDCSKMNVLIKYVIVWMGSIALNTCGTYLLTEWIIRFHWTERLASFAFTNIFMVPKIVVAVAVALSWNYVLQKHFVYRRNSFDRFLNLLENKIRDKMNYRDFLQKAIYGIIDPVVKGLIRVGVTPNFITTTGLVLNIVAAAVFVYAGLAGESSFFYIGLAGGIVLFAGLFDMLDGRVARVGGMVSRFGAFYDSVLDRYSEMFSLFGIVFLFIQKGYFWSAIVTFVALIGSVMVSYVRARAEGLGIECKVGFLQRPERVVLTSLGALFCGIFSGVRAFDPMYILIVPMWLIAIFANMTAFVRIRHCYITFKRQSGEG